MIAHSNAPILRLIADGEQVQWREVHTDRWNDYVPGESNVNPLVPNARIMWQQKPLEVTIAGVTVPAPLPVNTRLAPLRTYYAADVGGVREFPGDSTQGNDALEARTLHSTVEAARLHSTALRRLNLTFFR